MLKQRIVLLVALAVVSTVSPTVYQYAVEPRTIMEGNSPLVTIEIMSMQYDSASSYGETAYNTKTLEWNQISGATAFTVYLKLTNRAEADKILSPMQLDVYYMSNIYGRYVLIGTLITNEDYNIPAGDYVGSESETVQLNRDVTREYNGARAIKGTLYFSKEPGFKENANEALAYLLSYGQIGLYLKGNAQYGPITLPFEQDGLNLNQKLWDPNLILKDLFLYDKVGGTDATQFTLQVQMQAENASNIPFSIQEFNLGLYDLNDKYTAEDEAENNAYLEGAPRQKGWGIDHDDALDQPDPEFWGESDEDNDEYKIETVFDIEGEAYKFDRKNTMRNVFFALDFQDPTKNTDGSNDEYQQWFLSTLMNQETISNLELMGSAKILLGSDNENGFIVDMDYVERSGITFDKNLLRIQNVKIYQRSKSSPQRMFGNFTLGEIKTERMVVDTQAETIGLNMTAKMTLYNPYRFDYRVTNFISTYEHASGNVFAESLKAVSADINRAVRIETVDEENNKMQTIEPASKDIYLNLTTTYNTGNSEAGIYKVLEDLGVDPDLLNLTNPFYINKSKYSQEYDTNPLRTIEFLINAAGINPLAMLNEVDLYTLIKNYQPLECQHFGTQWQDPTDPNYDTNIQISTNSAMPHIGPSPQTYFYGVDSTYAYVPSISNWNQYYDNNINGEGSLKRNNTFEVISHTFPDTYFDTSKCNDSDLSSGNDIDGAILHAPKHNGDDYSDTTSIFWNEEEGIWQGDRTGLVNDNTPEDQVIWRVYNDGAGAWGHYWGTDVQGNNDRGYYMVLDLNNGQNVMFAQNFSLDPTYFPNGASDIDEVTVSFSYKYPNVENTQNLDDGYGVALFAWWNHTKAFPEFDYDGKYGTSPYQFDTRLGNRLEIAPNVTEWNTFTMDLTDDFKARIDKYMETDNADYLIGEIGFAGVTSGEDLLVYFDDIVINIKYKDYSANLTGQLSMMDIFEYLEELDPESGNMFTIMNSLSSRGYVDGFEFFKYLADDQSPDRAEGDGMEFFDFLQFNNVSLTTVTELLSKNYTTLGVGEKVNFLEMLTRSKYKVVEPDGDADYSLPNTYGDRILNPDYSYWTIEDPYYASKALADLLYENIFIDETTGKSFTGIDKFLENEFWFMLEGLDVSPVWVFMYLLTHGWTKNDIFDVLEALGFASETKVDYDPDRSEGMLTADIDTQLLVEGLEIFRDVLTYNFPMGENPPDENDVLLDGVQEFFEAFCSRKDGGRYIVSSEGFIDDPIMTYTDEFEIWDLGFMTIDGEIGTAVTRFALQMWVSPTTGGKCHHASWDVQPEGFYADYLVKDSDRPGFDDAGTKVIASNIRLNYKYGGKTFISQAGDAVSLFQFLDSYYFGVPYSFTDIDYTSNTALNYFNVSGKDFIDIITGYDRTEDKWDTNGNGRADEWVAPEYYAAGRRTGSNALEGWGNDYVDNRLYYDDSYQDLEGKIIWSDSPAFGSDIDSTIDPGADFYTAGAPPIVSLIDMIWWISETAGTPDPDDLFKWLIGELDDSHYRTVFPDQPIALEKDRYNRGVSNQKIWRFLRDASLNSTGFFEWLEKDKSIDSFLFLYQLNKTTKIVTPMNLLYFSLTPNMVQFTDGALSFMYHDALHYMSRDEADDRFWAFFNNSDYFTLDAVRALYRYLDEELNIFEMFMDLNIDVASWLNYLKQTIEPLEVIKRMKKLDPDPQQYLEFVPGTSSLFNVYANLTVSYEGRDLDRMDLNIASDFPLTTDTHFSNFMDTKRLVGNRFIIK